MDGRKFSSQDADLLEEILRSRRDVRGNRFESEPVPAGDLQRILNAAATAPSVGFSQPWEFLLVDDVSQRERVMDNFRKVNDASAHLFDERQAWYSQLKLEGIAEAPVNIAVFYRQSESPVLGQTSMAEAGRYSVVCAIQNMWLMARSLNIGLGWVSILEPEEMESVFDAPDSCSFVGYLCLGYVREFLERPELESIGWAEKKKLETVVRKDRF